MEPVPPVPVSASVRVWRDAVDRAASRVVAFIGIVSLATFAPQLIGQWSTGTHPMVTADLALGVLATGCAVGSGVVGRSQRLNALLLSAVLMLTLVVHRHFGLGIELPQSMTQDLICMSAGAALAPFSYRLFGLVVVADAIALAMLAPRTIEALDVVVAASCVVAVMFAATAGFWRIAVRTDAAIGRSIVERARLANAEAQAHAVREIRRALHNEVVFALMVISMADRGYDPAVVAATARQAADELQRGGRV